MTAIEQRIIRLRQEAACYRQASNELAATACERDAQRLQSLLVAYPHAQGSAMPVDEMPGAAHGPGGEGAG
jgi:hypothetical protein